MTSFVVTDTAGWSQLASGDLPTSGVSAGTYGDATHVGQFTVDAHGVITAANDIAISGGGGGYTTLFDTTLTVDTGTIDTGAGGIAAGYNALIMLLTGRTDEAVVLSNLSFTLNNDSAARYGFVWTGTTNVTPITGNNTAQTSWTAQVLGASAAANYAGSIRMEIHNYAGTTFYKTANLASANPDQSAAANMSMLNFGGSYQSTAAISRLAVTPVTGGAKLKAGTRLTIYGTP